MSDSNQMIREFIAEMITAAMVMNGLGRILGHYFPMFLFVPVPAGRLLHGLSGGYFCTRMDIFLQILFLLQLSSLRKQEKDN